VSVVKTVLMVIGAGCVGLMAGLLAFMAWVECATRRNFRRRDLPIKNDDTVLRVERSTWDRR